MKSDKIKNDIIKELELIADYTVVEYDLHYNLDKGTVTPANPTKYTVEDDITLNNPTRKGYTFAGWTEGSSETIQTSVRIYNEIDEKTERNENKAVIEN